MSAKLCAVLYFNSAMGNTTQPLDIYDALVEMSEEVKDPKAKSEAESLANEITSFKFLTLFVI